LKLFKLIHPLICYIIWLIDKIYQFYIFVGRPLVYVLIGGGIRELGLVQSALSNGTPIIIAKVNASYVTSYQITQKQETRK